MNQMETTEAILKTLNEPILLLDDKLRAIMANPAFYRVLQISPGFLEGKSVRKLVHSKNKTVQLAQILEPIIASDGAVENAEVACALPDQTQIIFVVNARTIPAKQDQMKMILVELHDITKERMAAQKIESLNNSLQQHISRLELTNKELESFSHSVSHDLRSPLRLINKIIHELLHKYGAKLPVDAIETINMISTGTQEMEKLINVLIKFSRTIQSRVDKRKVDLQKLVREVIEVLLADQNGRVIEFEIEELPPCYVDRTLFNEVLLNLISNSIKFTRPRETARIQIGSIDADGETVYFVRDNGVGFDMSNAAFLFTAFHRLHKQSEYEGSGIGLALVRRIVERHGGRIWCDSEVDRGATFYFTAGVIRKTPDTPKDSKI